MEAGQHLWVEGPQRSPLHYLISLFSILKRGKQQGPEES